MSYFGKTFKFEKHERFDEFLAALGQSKERIDEILKKHATLTLEKNGDNYTQTMPGHNTITFQSGVEFEEGSGQSLAKTTCVFKDDTLTQTQKYSDGLVITYKKKFSDNKVVDEVTSSVWDGVACRYFSA